MSDGQFRIGIIGAGGISRAHTAAAAASGGRIVVSAVVDPVRAQRDALAQDTGAQAFDSIENLVEAVSAGLALDGLVVCTPPSARLKIAKAAFKAKLPVLMEKPIAHTLADARKLAAMSVKNRKVPAFIAYCHRFAPAMNLAKDLIDQGKIGKLTRFENVFACDLPGHEGKWFSDPKAAGGGAFLDMGSHSVDLFHAVVGPSAAVGSVFAHKWKKRTETAGTVLLRGTKKRGNFVPAGVAGVILSGWAETARFEVAIVGDAGMLSYNYEKPAELVFKDLNGQAETIAVESHEVRFARQLAAFADAVQKKAKSPLATFADGLAAAAVHDKATRLAK
ncbi:MAG: Gfo/Idh/MocA family oxidoreductase [Phycisphaeraceae bacterium]|nr:Gfo/Idh/MocA family oxidoreductase [Phycisphaeraceae bacterium]